MTRAFASAVTVGVAALLTFAAVPAQAAETHNFLSTFNASDAPQGALAPFGGVLGLAVDDSAGPSAGHVYVADYGNNVVDAFSATGAYISQITGSETVSGSFSTPWGLAVDPSTGDLYVADSGHGVIDKFDPEGELIKAFGEEGQINGLATPAGFFSPTGLAVDPTTGDLYVGDISNAVIDVYSSSGEYLRQFSTNGGSYGIAADSTGDVIFTNGSQAIVYEAATGNPNPAFGEGSGVLDSSGSSSAAAVDPSTGDLYVADSGDIAQYDSAGNPIDTFGSGHFSNAFGGLGIGKTSGDVYAADNPNDDVALFGPELTVPTTTTGNATEIHFDHATLNATVDPSGVKLEECAFEYGTSAEPYEHTSSCAETPEQIGTGTSPVDVHVEVAALTPGLTYHFRLHAVNENGATDGSDQTFTTIGRFSASADFGSEGSGAGQLTEPSDVAVDESTGDLYVADTGNHRVDQLSSTGAFIRAWGWGVENGEEKPQTCAASCQAGIPVANHRSSGAGQLTAPAFLAVDNSSGPSHGDVYVAENVPAQSAVNEVQQLTLHGATGGSFALSFKGRSTAETDTGDTTAGFDEITNVGANGSAFFLGEMISGSGIPPETTLAEIHEIGTGVRNLVLSNPATKTATGVTLSTSIPYDASAQLLQSVLNRFISEVKVEGPEGGPYAIEFTGEDGAADEPLIETEPGDLTLPGATAEVIETQAAVPAVPFLSRVQKFSPEGALISSWGSDGAFDFSGEGSIDGIAVDGSGDLFVAPTVPHWNELSQDGNHRTTISTEEGSEHALAGSNGHGIAIGPSGSFYQSSTIGVSIASSESSDGLDTFEAGDPGNPTGFTLDHSTGDLYVDHGTYIYEFPASGGCALFRNGPCSPADTFGEGDLTSAAGLAFDSSSQTLYAADTGADDIAVFTAVPRPTLNTASAQFLSPASAALNGTVDPPAASEVEECRFEYTTDSEFHQHGYDGAATVPCSPEATSTEAEVTAEVSGLQPSTTYHFRLAATTAADHGFTTYGRDLTFTTGSGVKPSIDTSSAATTPTTATLAARINPNSAPTVYRFQYGTTPAYGSQTPLSESIGEDATDHAVSAEITGLAPATTYHFRVLAINLNGSTLGPDQTFDTPALPAVASTSTSAVGTTTATLDALIKPGFRSTTYHFEFGTGTAYGDATPQSAPIGSDNTSHQATAALTGLLPATTYHFRVVGTNEIGATPGPDQTFTTAPEEEKKVTPPPCTKNAILKHGTCVCKHGFVKKHDKCVKKTKPHHNKKHHKRGGKK